jgi:SNF2 family DNA or RNA helicase
MIFEPHDYQRAAIDFLLKNRYAGLFADPGLGKTAITLSLIKRFHRHPEFKGALIIAPLRVAEIVWPAEIQKWDQFRDLTYRVLHGPNRLDRLREKADIYLLNAENIFWLLEEKHPCNMLVVDESSKFKSHSAKRFKKLKKQLDQFQRRIILTGTPAPNSMMDLYPQVYLLDQGEALGRFITHYRQRYFYPVNFRNFTEWNLKPGADRVIQQQIAHQIMRIDAEDHLDLPPLVYHEVQVKLPPKAATTYRQLEKQFFALIDGAPVLLGSAASAYNACRQVANGCLYEPPPMLMPRKQQSKRKTLELHSAKADAVQEIINELQGKPALIAYHFKHDLEQLLDKFGADTPYLGGGVSNSKSAEIVKAWNAGKIPILLGHPQSIAHGLNLQQGGHDIIWFSLTDNLENYMQFNQRVYRQGVRKQVRIHHILADKTVDLAIMRRLDKKDKTQKALLDAIREYRNEINC